MDKKENIEIDYNLLIKKAEDFLTENEKEEFDHWYEASPSENRECSREVVEGHRRKTQMLFAEKTGSQEDQSTSQKRGRKRYWRLGVAASVAILVSLGIYFYGLIPGSMPEAAIEVGSSKAVLTLEDGTEVPLEKGEAYTTDNINSDGESLIYGTGKEGTEAYNELTVPRGGEFFLQLADSTRVWLNSDTRIRYPNTFTDGEPRIVALLYGEAFFEVSPAAKHGGGAFKVTTRNQEIEVLGTQFNVAAYREDQAVTSTLVAGKVTVSNGSAKKELKPGQQSVVAAGDTEIVVNEVDVYNDMAWKDGFFGFENKSLKEVMQVLSRWYDIEVEFRDKKLENHRLGGILSRKQRIQNILTALSGINDDLHFEIKGRQVIVN